MANPVSTAGEAQGLRVLVLDREVLRMLEEIPKESSAEFNRALKLLGSKFMRRFTSERLRKGVIQVHRKGKAKKAGLFIPLKARLAGFTGRLIGSKGLERKALRLGTRNPVMIAHELGATIRPTKGKFLAVRVTTAAGAKAVGSNPRAQLPFRARVRQVRLPARLGFLQVWDASQPEVRAALANALDRATVRAARKKARA